MKKPAKPARLKHQPATTAISQSAPSHQAPAQVDAVQHEQNLFRTILENLPSIVFCKDKDGRYVLSNRAHQCVLGATEEAILGKTAVDFHPPELARQYLEEEIQIMRTGEPLPPKEELALHHETGKQRWHLTSRIPLKDESGHVTGVLGISHDITERKRAEVELLCHTKELAALNSLTRRVSSSLSLETVVASALQELLNAVKTDIAFLFLREGERLMLGGIAPESGRERFGQIPEHRVGECLCGLAVRQGRPLYSRDIFSDLRCTWEECKKAGYRSFAALPLRAGDEIIGVVGLASVTERDFEQQAKFLETLASAVSASLQNARLFAKTKQAEDEIRTILRTTMDGFYLVDKAGRFLDTNDAYCRIIGYSREELLRMAIKDIEAIDTDEVIKKRIQQIMDTGYFCFETKHRRKDGKIIIIEASVTALKDGDGKLVVFMRDITDRKQAEAKLNERMEELLTWENVTLGREERVMELKKEVNELLAEMGKPPRYRDPEEEIL